MYVSRLVLLLLFLLLQRLVILVLSILYNIVTNDVAIVQDGPEDQQLFENEDFDYYTHSMKSIAVKFISNF